MCFLTNKENAQCDIDDTLIKKKILMLMAETEYTNPGDRSTSCCVYVLVVSYDIAMLSKIHHYIFFKVNR